MNLLLIRWAEKCASPKTFEKLGYGNILLESIPKKNSKLEIKVNKII